MQTRSFSGDGIILNCVDYGTAGKPPMLLVHGGSAHARWWDFVAQAFTDRFHVLALDQRGHGDSPWTAQWAYGGRHYVADLKAIIDNWGLGAPVLVGHSMGGYNVMAYAVDNSASLRALIVADGPTDYPHEKLGPLRKIAARPGSVYDSLAEAVANFKLLPRDTLATPEVLRHIGMLSFRQREDGKWVHKMDRRTSLREAHAITDRLGEIVCPTLIVKPEKSPVMNAEYGRKMAARIPHGRFVEVAPSSHHVLLDNPTGLIAAMEEFLAEI